MIAPTYIVQIGAFRTLIITKPVTRSSKLVEAPRVGRRKCTEEVYRGYIQSLPNIVTLWGKARFV